MRHEQLELEWLYSQTASVSTRWPCPDPEEGSVINENTASPSSHWSTGLTNENGGTGQEAVFCYKQVLQSSKGQDALTGALSCLATEGLRDNRWHLYRWCPSTADLREGFASLVKKQKTTKNKALMLLAHCLLHRKTLWREASGQCYRKWLRS